MVTLRLSQDQEADRLLSKDRFALLIGMVLDQQVPLEWAFAAPAELARRLGKPLEPATLASMDPDALAALFSAKPALHRYPGSMAARVHELSRLVCDRYGGRVANIWKGVKTGPELLARIKELPGFGDQKARIFLALLGKQLGVRPEGWEETSAPFGEPGSFRSVADITGPDTLVKVRAYKAGLKAAHKAATGKPAGGNGRGVSGPASGKRPAASAPRSTPAGRPAAPSARRSASSGPRSGRTATPTAER